MAIKAPSTDFIIEFKNYVWRAWCVSPDGTQQPIRFSDCPPDRDSLISDDAMGLMQLAHAIVANTLPDAQGFDDHFRSASGQERLRRFFEDMILPIKSNRPQHRQVISAREVATWLSHHQAAV